MIQRRKPLQNKTPLKRSAIKQPIYAEALAKAKEKQARARNEPKAPKEKAVKAAKSRAKKPTVSQLKKKADTAFSIYIRLRDAEFRAGNWWCLCCTCDRWIPLKEIQNGHFQSRRYMNTRYHEKNCHPQCVKCNIFNNGEQYKYSLFIDRKYGPGTAKMLEQLAQKTKQYKTWELENMINQYKASIKAYEEKQQYGTTNE